MGNSTSADHARGAIDKVKRGLGFGACLPAGLASEKAWLGDGANSNILVTMRLDGSAPVGVLADPVMRSRAYRSEDGSVQMEYMSGALFGAIEATSASDLDAKIAHIREKAGCESLRFSEIARDQVNVPLLSSRHHHGNYDRMLWIRAKCVRPAAAYISCPPTEGPRPAGPT